MQGKAVLQLTKFDFLSRRPGQVKGRKEIFFTADACKGSCTCMVWGILCTVVPLQRAPKQSFPDCTASSSQESVQAATFWSFLSQGLFSVTRCFAANPDTALHSLSCFAIHLCLSLRACVHAYGQNIHVAVWSSSWRSKFHKDRHQS